MMIGNMNTINLTYNALTATNNALEKTARALSTGLKAAHVSDDASGSAISTNISAQVASVDRAVRNAQDGISLLQTAEGGLGQINSMLQRMRELSVQAANDTLTVQDRGYIQMEINELRANINNVASNTTFNSKRLLDGSSAATWTSDDVNTKLIADGALTQIDQFGQKKHVEGNYRIEVKANAGQGQVQKSAIFSVSKVGQSEWDGYDYEININTGQDVKTGLTSGIGWEFKDGVLTIRTGGRYSIIGDTTTTSNTVVIKEGADSKVKLKDVNITASKGSPFQITGANVKVFLEGENTFQAGGPEQAGLEVRNSLNGGPKGSVEINSIKGSGSTEGKLTTRGTGCGAGIGGSCHTPTQNVGYSVGAITINGGTIIATSHHAGAGIGGGGHFIDHPSQEVGAHVQITINGGNITATGGDRGGAGIGSGTMCPNDSSNVDFIRINCGKIKATGGDGGAAIGGGRDANSGVIRISPSAQLLELNGWIDEENGQTQPIGRGENGVRTGKLYNDVAFAPSSIGDYATIDEIPEFYNHDGVCLVKEPQTITISQGNGKSTDVTLYSKDTIEDVRRKLNDAIAFGLGQSAYTDNNDQFVTFVSSADNQGSETVEGTFVMRSAVAGAAGKLTFASENQDLLNAFGFNTIQEAEENTFTASVYDAHSGKVLVSNAPTQGNRISGALGPNTSIEFDSMANVRASWDEGSKRYILSSEAKAYSTTLHVRDRSTSFQIGQAEGQDIYLNIGDMRSSAIGIDGVNVMTRENAAKSITLLDAAIHKVGVQRSRLGAYQNELEYNMNSLTQTGLHLQESESRIKDADMAKEYMEFVKFQILNQTGSSMLSQSSRSARAAMSLITM